MSEKGSIDGVTKPPKVKKRRDATRLQLRTRRDDATTRRVWTVVEWRPRAALEHARGISRPVTALWCLVPTIEYVSCDVRHLDTREHVEAGDFDREHRVRAGRVRVHVRPCARAVLAAARHEREHLSQ